MLTFFKKLLAMATPKKKHKMTVREAELVSGKKDNIKNLDGSNAYANKHVDTIVAEFRERLPDMILPDTLPESILLVYPGGRSVTVDDTKLASQVLNFVGLMPRE